MTQRSNWLITSALLLGLGCGSETDAKPTPRPTPPVMGGDQLPCRATSCGNQEARAAIPTRDLLKLDFNAATRQIDASGLEPYSSYHRAVLEEFDEINDVIDAVFDDLEYAAGAEPTIDDGDHLWRAMAGDTEVVLDIDHTGPGAYALALYEGDVGFEPDTPLVAGSVILNAGRDSVERLSLEIDVAATAAVEGLDAAGRIAIEASPFEGGYLQLTYETEGLAYEGEQVENGTTRYWIFGADDYGASFLNDADDEEYTVYVRWGADGGRWDGHAAYDDPDGDGILDDITTNCWDASGSEVFAAETTIDEDLNFEGQLAGEESDCPFGPIADHPDPGTTFENLPGEGEWQEIDFVGCNPEEQSCPCDESMPCGTGESCVDGECLPGCDSDEDCDAGDLCEENMCIAAECDIDDDCPEGSSCDEEGYCVAD